MCECDDYNTDNNYETPNGDIFKARLLPTIAHTHARPLELPVSLRDGVSSRLSGVARSRWHSIFRTLWRLNTPRAPSGGWLKRGTKLKTRARPYNVWNQMPKLQGGFECGLRAFPSNLAFYTLKEPEWMWYSTTCTSKNSIQWCVKYALGAVSKITIDLMVVGLEHKGYIKFLISTDST